MSQDQIDPLDLAMQEDAPSAPSRLQLPPQSQPQSSASDIDPLDLAMQDDSPASHVVAPPASRRRAQGTYAERVMGAESGGNPNAKNPNSSATGLGQFTKETWVEQVKRWRPDLAQGKSDDQILQMRTDPELSKQMIDAYGNQNADYLGSHGVLVNDASKYGAHWFGPSGFEQIYKAPSNTPIEKIIGARAAAANRLTGMTTDQVKTLIAQKMGGDYMPEDLSAEDTLSMAAHNLLPSTKKMAAGVASSILHPFDTGKALWNLGVGLRSKIDGAAGKEQDPDKKAQDEAAIDALMDSYKEKYGDLNGFKSYLAHDPAGVLMDLSTVLGGGEIAATKTGSLIGRAGEAASRIGAESVGAATSAVGNAVSDAGRFAGKVGANINPLNPLSILNPESSVLSARKFVDGAGNLSPKVDSMLNRVSGGVLSASDFSDPLARQHLLEVLDRKGLTPESVREGILRSQGLEAPTAAVTGKAAPVAAAETTRNAIESNAQQLADRAKQIGGAQMSGGEIGSHLERAFVNSKNSAIDKYSDIRNMPGEFVNGSLGGADFNQKLASHLGTSGLPTDPSLFSANGLDKAKEAHDLIDSVLNHGNTLLNGPGGKLDSSEILRVRQRLNDIAKDAKGTDIRATRDVINAFDDHVADASANGRFIDYQKNAANTDLANKIREASDAYRNHMNTFEVSNGQNNNIVSAVKKLKDGITTDPTGKLIASGDADAHVAAQSALEKDLFNPAKGGLTHSKLVEALGGQGSAGEEAVNGTVRNALMNSENGVFRPLKNSDELLSNPNSVVSRAFRNNPEALKEARRIHVAHKINSSKPKPGTQAQSLLRGTIGPIAARSVATALGAHFYNLPGALIGASLEHGAEKLLAKSAARHALEGAPKSKGLIRKATDIASRYTRPTRVNLSRAAEFEKEREQDMKKAAATGGRIGRASGGRLSDIEPLVQRLMKRHKMAKKMTDKTTEPLLNAPDEHIVQALKVAQDAI